MAEIMTWATWKKRNKKLPRYGVRDGGGKGWILMTVAPTLEAHGYNYIKDHDIDRDTRKPRQILMEDFADVIEKSSEVVYFVVRSGGNYDGFFKYLDVYWKPKDDEA